MASKKTLALNILIGAKQDSTLGSVLKNVGSQISGLSTKELGKLGAKAAAAGVALKAGAAVGKAAWKATTAAVKLTAEGLGKCVESAAEFQKEMANVSTLLTDSDLGTVNERLAELSDSVLAASNATGVATEDLTNGLYQVISAFGDTADSAKIMELAAKSGAAGCATTTDAVNLLSAVTKAYGDTSIEANQKVSDLAFETVRLGQTTYPELASSIQQVTSLSSSLGVSQEELFGVFAASTGVVGSAAEVSTKLKAVYTKLMKPTKDMTAALKSMGYASGEAAIADLGLQGTLDALTKYSDKTGVSLAKLYGSANAAVLATALTGDLSGALTEKTAAMGSASGATDTAFGKQTQTFAYQKQMLQNLGQNALTQIGSLLLPQLTQIATNVLPVLTSTLEKVTPIIGEIFASIDWTAIGDLVDQLLPVLLEAIAGLLPVIKQLMPPLVQFATQVLAQMLPPLVTIAQNLLPMITPLLEPILSIILTLMPLIMSLMTVLQPIFQVITSGISLILSVLNMVMPIINGILTVVLSVIGAIANAVSGLIATLIGFFTNLFNNISGIIKSIVNTIISGINWIIEKINGFIDKANSIKIPEGVPLIGGAGFNFAHIPTIPQMAAGGIVTQATQAIIGEGSEPEAVIPLSRLGNMLGGDIGGGINITFAPVINCDNGDPYVIQGAVEDEFEKFKVYMERYLHQNRRLQFSH